MQARASAARAPFVVGLAGAQGSGKSTLARIVVDRLAASGARAATISLDDFYLGRAARRRLAARVHPLFVTRGAPGTHDVDLALDIVSACRRGAACRAPVFAKRADEALAREDWREIPAGLDVLVFEGWCLGARPQGAASLDAPVNMLERVFDAEGVWRRAVNAALGETYQALFAENDHLVYLRPPSFEIVPRWRVEQERALAGSLADAPSPGLMSADEISFFVQHFERLTRWMMKDLPWRASLVLELDAQRRARAAVFHESAPPAC